MTNANALQIAVLPGDGIGPEVMTPCLALLTAAAEACGCPGLAFRTLPCGAAHYRDRGEALPASTLEAARAADAILLGAMGLPEVRYPDGTEIVPQVELRVHLGLYAGVRPLRAIPGLPRPLSDPRAAAIDMVLIRESTEGLFASLGKGRLEDDRIASETLVITRETTEKLCDFAFRLGARRRAGGGKGRVTCIDKANVFKAFAFFRQIFDERARAFPDLRADHDYVDAAALKLVRNPWDYDVMVTENMFGDILSDLGAGLIGGMGVAPSADIGEAHGVFQPCHGTAPDIAGQGKANPTAMFLSGAMMLDWLAERQELPSLGRAAEMIREAVDRAFVAEGLLPFELGGRDGTERIAETVLSQLSS